MALTPESIDTDVLNTGMYAEKFHLFMRDGLDPIVAWYFATHPDKNPMDVIAAAKDEAQCAELPPHLR